ncbi:hypothetical protein [Azospirillum sp. Marseille-Q6669]
MDRGGDFLLELVEAPLGFFPIRCANNADFILLSKSRSLDVRRCDRKSLLNFSKYIIFSLVLSNKILCNLRINLSNAPSFGIDSASHVFCLINIVWYACDEFSIFVATNMLSRSNAIEYPARRPGKAYYLNEGQALVICALSRTPQAALVRRQIIEVFLAYRRGVLPVAEEQQQTIAHLAAAPHIRAIFKGGYPHRPARPSGGVMPEPPACCWRTSSSLPPGRSAAVPNGRRRTR